ncbi:MAG: ORF6N domain-containing protein [Lachnospiraceae bacterium]|nr:ORF6N domain-containing protein [Lachnospiraceae bacterium]
MGEKTELMTVDNICDRVYVIRGQQVMLDYDLATEQVYHCGASSRDAGKKLCAINKIEKTAMIHSAIDGLLLEEDMVL